MVVGASIAGLLAARVLADAFEQVTLVDRDPLERHTGVRRGVPQAQHVHVLLVAGQAIMEQLCPGLADDLVDRGALVLDFHRDVRLHAADGFLAAGPDELLLHYASRPLIEELLRARVLGHERVTLRPGCQVTGPVPGADGDTVDGVVLVDDGSQRQLHADLVVDATGRSARSAAWLEELGYPTPALEEVHVDLAYRTCQVQRPPEDRRAMLIMPSSPRSRGAAVAPVEGDRWLVTLFGMHGDHPPGEHTGLRRFASGLPTDEVHDLLDRHELAEPEIARHRFPSNLRRRHDLLERHPRGLVCVGDAMASFNPIYGQGMSVAALQALALHHTLAAEDLDQLAPAFYPLAGRIVDDVWRIAAGGDFQFAQTHGPMPPGTGVVNRYVTRLHRKAHADGQLATAFARVATLERSPTSLFHPSVAWRVLRPGMLDTAVAPPAT